MGLPLNEIYVASDHAGVELKQQLIKAFPKWNWVDCGPESEDSVDYPDFANRVCENIRQEGQWGLLICGSGQGMSMRANKFSHIRAALVYNSEIAELARAHNDANVICLGARFLDLKSAIPLLQVFFSTRFLGDRHARRVEKIGSPTT